MKLLPEAPQADLGFFLIQLKNTLYLLHIVILTSLK